MTPDQQNTSPGRWMFVPDGWQVVPKVMDDDMRDKLAEIGDGPIRTPDEVWTAMLAASPSPPEVKEMAEEEIARVIESYCFVYIQSKDGKPLPTENIQCIEVRGIDLAAGAVLHLLAPSDQDATGESNNG